MREVVLSEAAMGAVKAIAIAVITEWITKVDSRPSWNTFHLQKIDMKIRISVTFCKYCKRSCRLILTPNATLLSGRLFKEGCGWYWTKGR